MLWFLVRRSGGPAVRRRRRPGIRRSRATVAGFLAPIPMAQLGAVLLYNQIPLLANFRMGNAIGAVFFIAWQAAVVIVLETFS